MYATGRLFVRLGLLSLSLFGVSIRAYAQEPASCSADLSNYVLPCFEAYKTELRPYHYTEIDNIAAAIAQFVRDTGQQVQAVAIYGYGVFFNPDDPVIQNSQERADNVKAVLDQKLRNRGLQLKRNQFVTMGLGDSASPAQSSSQDDRWMLRRVEVKVSYASDKQTKKQAKNDCEPDEQMVSRLESFDKDYSNEGREDAVRCMSDLLAKHYSCKSPNNAQYLHTAGANVWERIGFVERFWEGRMPTHNHACAGKKGEELKNCFGTLDGDIVQGMKDLSRIIVIDSIEAQRRDVRKFAECKVGRWILAQYEGNPRSPYKCYPVQAEAFKECL
jgi:hypothetical protein